jgi:cell wall-associated NlpC family hydrolase
MPEPNWTLSTSSANRSPAGKAQPPTQPLVALPNAPFKPEEVGRSIDLSVIRPGDLIVTRDDGLKSTIIRGFEGYSKDNPEGVSHVMMAVGNGFVVEAIGEGVKITPFAEALKGDTYAAVFHYDKLTNPDAAVAFAMSKIGAKYDYLGVLTNPRFGIYKYVGAQGFQMTDHYFCSELISEAYKAANAPLFLPPSVSSPADYPALGFLDGVHYVGTLIGPTQPGTSSPALVPIIRP